MPTIAKLNAQLSGDGTAFKNVMERAAEVTEKFGERVNKAIGKAVTPLDRYNKQVEKLKAQLKSGRINIDQYAAGMEKATRGLESSTAMASRLSLLKAGLLGIAAAGAAAAAAIAAYTIKQGLAAGEVHKYARSIGLAANDIYAFERALVETGQTTERAGEILLGLSRTIAGANAGNFAAADAFRQLGLSARSLASLNSSDAMRAIADAIAAIPDRARRAAMAVRIFGDDAARLLPILQKGGKFLDDARMKEMATGKSIDPRRAAMWEQWAISAAKFERAIEGIGLAIAEGVIPYLNALLEMLPKSEKVAGSVSDSIRDVLKNTAAASQFFDDMYNSAKAFGLAVKWAINAFIDDTLAMILAATKALQAIAPPQFADSLQASREELERLKAASKEITDGIETDLTNTWNRIGTKSTDWLDELFRKVDGKAGMWDGVFAGIASINVGTEQMKNFGTIITDNMSPLEKFTSRIDELDNALKSGGITWDQYAIAVSKAANELDAANQLTKMGLAAGVRAGTTEAYSAIVTAKQQDDMTMKETPQERMKRLMEQSLIIQQQQRDYARKTAEALGNVKEVDF